LNQSPSNASLAVLVAAESARNRAIELSNQLRVPLLDGSDLSPSTFDFLLTCAADHVELREPGQRVAPLIVDFVAGATAHRRKSGQSRKQPLARAVGIKGEGCCVLDATAGLGRDAFLLACLGCTVLGVERSPILCALLQDAHRRGTAALDPALRSIIGRLKFFCADARDYLAALPAAQHPDVIYVDPMYPARLKTALEGREIRVCRALVGSDADADELLARARRVARQRVVVKRHRHAPPLDRPDFEISGRTVRYDVYMTRS